MNYDSVDLGEAPGDNSTAGFWITLWEIQQKYIFKAANGLGPFLLKQHTSDPYELVFPLLFPTRSVPWSFAQKYLPPNLLFITFFCPNPFNPWRQNFSFISIKSFSGPPMHSDVPCPSDNWRVYYHYHLLLVFNHILFSFFTSALFISLFEDG